jgi:hypothetical protein
MYLYIYMCVCVVYIYIYRAPQCADTGAVANGGNWEKGVRDAKLGVEGGQESADSRCVCVCVCVCVLFVCFYMGRRPGKCG